jgi:ABC-type bacteriocin/lantibiotic exporter with double-glycine peptidase domain
MFSSTTTMFRRVGRLALREIEGLRALIVYAIGVGLLSLAVPLTVQAVIQNVAAGGLRQPLIVLSGLLLLGLGLSALFTMAQIVLVELAARRIFVHTAERFLKRLRNATPTAFIRGPRAVVHRFFDVITIEKAFTSLVLDGLAAFLQILVGTTLLAIYHPALLAFDILLVALALSPLLLGRIAAKTAMKESSAKFAVGAQLEKLAQRAQREELTPQEAAAEDHCDHAIQRWLRARDAHFHIVAWQTGLLVGTQALATAGLLALGGWLVIEGELTLGQLVAAELVMTATVSSLARVGKLVPKVFDLGAALEKVASVDQLRPDPSNLDEVSHASV